MMPELQALIEMARRHRMTREEAEAQRINFAFGNLNIGRPGSVTREAVAEAAKDNPVQD